MRQKLIVALILAAFSTINCQAFILSPKAEISIITCAPGNLIYECFGHTAIRVSDSENNFDYVFNYGIFEFSKPNFELNFAKGYLEYKLGVQHFESFVPTYTKDNRTITEQVLDLNDGEKQKLVDFLLWNEKPENRYYFYDYFYDNCATRVRDVIEEEAGKTITYKTNFKKENGYTIRELIAVFAHNNEWSRLGIDLCLGIRIDKVIEDRTYAFLPDYYMVMLQNAFVGNSPLVKKTNIIYKGAARESDKWYTSPFFIFFILCTVLFIATFKSKNTKLIKVIDNSLLAIVGFIGIFLLSLWLFTDHNTTHWNLNLLWAMPLHSVVAFFPKHIRATYFKYYAILLALIILNWFWFPQEFNLAFLPFVLLICYRSYEVYKRLSSL